MDRFELLELIGEGPLGKVWKARDRQDDRTCALRLIEEGDAARVEALLAAARRAAAIKDPRVVEVHGCGRDGETVWVAMELVTGRTLEDVLADEGPFPAERLVEVGGALCDALEAGHQGGVVHRDLKPSSVMLTDGGIKVMDFGLAHARARAGTPPYASPESQLGYPVDRRSDLYSLGVLLIELATGAEFEHPADDAPVALGAHLPPPLCAAILRLVSQDAGARFRSAAAAGAALRQSVAPAPRRRRRWIGAAVALAGIVGVALLARSRFGTLVPVSTFFVGCSVGAPLE
jgi:serine/threonine protein kinase